MFGALVSGVIVAILVGVFCSMIGLATFSWQWFVMIIVGNGLIAYLNVYLQSHV
jgi:hypothetical protein